MNKVDCDIIGDLMPLYAENLVSNNSKALIEDHIKNCSTCSDKLKNLQKEINIPIDHNYKPMISIKKRLEKNKLINILLTILITSIIIILTIINLTAPIPMEYNEDLISFTETENGALISVISDKVAGYSVDKYLEDGVYVYHITCWDSIWHKYLMEHERQSFIINSNTNGEYNKVASIYYYTGETWLDKRSTEDILIYGYDMYSSGGVLTLPRLVLSYYFMVALIITLIGFLITIIVNKNKALQKTFIKVTLLPIAFIISILCVKGGDLSSHYLIKDMSGILLLMLPIYGLMLLISNKYRLKNH